MGNARRSPEPVPPIIAADAVDIEAVTTPAGLDALRPEWVELWRGSPSATPFQSPGWLIPWWRNFGRGDLLVLTMRRTGRLVGLLPLFLHEEPTARKLLLLGTGITDYLDALLDPGLAETAITTALDHLRRSRHRWDLCDFLDLRPQASLLAAPAPAGWSDEVRQGDPCPVLALPAMVDQLRQVVPALKLRDLRRAWRRAETLGPLRFERATAETIEELLDALFRLHAACWANRDEPGVLVDPAIQRFHRDAAAGLLALGALRLYGLRAGGRIVASYYGFAGHGRAYAYLGGFDPDLTSQSLGTLIIGHAIEEAVREGAREFHFLRGNENYKYRWGATDRRNHARRFRRGDDTGT